MARALSRVWSAISAAIFTVHCLWPHVQVCVVVKACTRSAQKDVHVFFSGHSRRDVPLWYLLLTKGPGNLGTNRSSWYSLLFGKTMCS